MACDFVHRPVAVTVLGAGSWGTVLAHHLRLSGHSVTLWGRDPEVLRQVAEHRRNPRYFGDESCAEGIQGEPDMGRALEGREAVVVSVPSAVVREVAARASEALVPDALVISTAKGLEGGTQARMSEVLAAELGRLERITALSGPTFALEVLRGLPAAAVMAGATLAASRRAAALFHHGTLRVYTSIDLAGVELGGVLKNVVAVAAGVTDGFGMGHNARAALLTRGLAEMTRLVVALGGQASTMTGLSGLGDLLLTATSDLSRNRRVGLRLGRGERLDAILADLGQVAEGVSAARTALELARQQGVEAPILEEVNRIVAGESTAAESVRRLMARAPKSET